MQAQQISVKVFVTADSEPDQEALIPIFHKWIRENRLGDKLLIDVTDYKHVPNGPGVMIIADHAHYGLDEGVGGGTGLLFSRRRDALGPAAPKLREAAQEALFAAAALEQEPTVKGKLRFDTTRLLVRVTSRLAATNTAEEFERFAPAAQALAEQLWPDAAVTVTRESQNERAPLGAFITGAATPLTELLERLG